VAILVIWMAALALRVPHLDERPMHTDEAVQAMKTDILWRTGKYVYDPEEYHGPTLYYLTLPFLWLSGQQQLVDVDAVTFRMVPVLFGAGLVLLLWLIRDGLGRWACTWAAVYTAISPAMVFYSRYYIQETLLVFFTFLAVVAAYRYFRSGWIGWSLLVGACLGLMHATKETWVIAVGAMLAAALLTILWTHWVDDRRINWQPWIRPKVKARALIFGWAVSTLLFSAFFTNPRGPLDSVLTYTTYLERGGGESEHNHPWNYYLSTLLLSKSGPIIWSEALIVVMSVVGMVLALWHRGIGRAHLSFVRFVTFYTLIMIVVYSAISYKTPWCMLGFLHGMILLAGFGTVALVRILPGIPLKIVASLVLIVASAQLGKQAYAANFGRLAFHPRNPYVYAHPNRDVVELEERLADISQVAPQGDEMLVAVFAPEEFNYWPLPWYLRRFTNVGYWHDLEAPEVPAPALQAPVVIVAPEFQEAFDQRNQGKYYFEGRGLRPGVVIGVNIRSDLWQAFLKERAKASPSGE